MAEEVFKKLDSLEMGGQIKIHFERDAPVEVEGIEIENPFDTTVQIVRKQRLDEKEGHDVDGIVTKKRSILNRLTTMTSTKST